MKSDVISHFNMYTIYCSIPTRINEPGFLINDAHVSLENFDSLVVAGKKFHDLLKVHLNDSNFSHLEKLSTGFRIHKTGLMRRYYVDIETF